MDVQLHRYSNILLPARKFIPGKGIHPRKDPRGSHIPPLPLSTVKFSPETWRESIHYLYAIDLFNLGYWWEAHEVLEDLWIETGRHTPVATFIQGIIQISAALLKDSQSVARGARRLSAKGLSKIRRQTGVFLGIRVERFAGHVEAYLEQKSLALPQIMLEGR